MKEEIKALTETLDFLNAKIAKYLAGDYTDLKNCPAPKENSLSVFKINFLRK